MYNLPFETYNINGEELQTLEVTCKALEEKYLVNIPPQLGIDINQFACSKYDGNVKYKGTILMDGCYLTLMETHSVTNNARGGSIVMNYLHQLWAFVKLKRDFGRILIRRETFVDKVLEILHPIELDFDDDRAFSYKFYVLTDDRDKAILNMTANFRNTIFDMHPHWTIEITGSDLLIYNNRSISPAEAMQLTAFANKIALIS